MQIESFYATTNYMCFDWANNQKYIVNTLYMLLKGTHTVCFSISFYNVNQKSMSPTTNFHCEPQGLLVLLSEIRQCIYVLCDFLLTTQMALSFNIKILTGYIFIVRPN